MVGIIPAVNIDTTPLPYTPPLEMLPIGTQMVDGVKCFKPLSQIIVDGMVVAGADHIICSINTGKMEIMQFYGDGGNFGIPFMYVYADTYNPLTSILAAYNYVCDETVLVGQPGITNPGCLVEVATAYELGECDAAMSVAQNTKVDAEGNIALITQGQLMGAFTWGKEFTSVLRQLVCENNQSDWNLVSAFNTLIKDGVKIRAVKLPFSTFVHGASNWAQIMKSAPANHMSGMEHPGLDSLSRF